MRAAGQRKPATTGAVLPRRPRPADLGGQACHVTFTWSPASGVTLTAS
jgi:hypothetical protein